jgi:hypothetical protein
VLSKTVEYGNKLLELYKEKKESLEENEEWKSFDSQNSDDENWLCKYRHPH